MYNKLEQSQNLLLKQTLSIKQIQYLKLLAMNVTELGNYLTSLNTENPIVDLKFPREMPNSQSNDNINIATWLNHSPHINGHNYTDDEQQHEITPQGQIEDDRKNLLSHIKSQFDFSLQAFDISLLNILLGSLDKKGYLSIDEKTVAAKGYPLDLVYEAISYLQSLDPVGIGARNLKECLFIQLKRKGISDPIVFSMIENHLEDLAHGYFQKISKALNCNIEKIKYWYRQIRNLNPVPASGFGTDQEAHYVIPDITILETPLGLSVRYNKEYQPHISINKGYLELARQNTETREYINKKMAQAVWVIKAISSRQNTIEKIVSVILERQMDFFTGTGSLCPLKLKDIADKISVHESTVSRAISDKYLECKRGIFPLKYFFTGEVVTQNSENEDGSVSTSAIQQRILEIIKGENRKKPYSDNDILKILENEGISIARRTVAKYRQILGIEGSSIRKETKS